MTNNRKLMKRIKLLMIALVAMLGLGSCEKQDWIDVDYSKDIVGTWTILEPDHAAAYIFKADGTVSTTGVDSQGQWEDVNGTYSVVNNKITMKFESGHNIEGSFDIIPGQAFSLVDNTGRHTYQYCKEDLSEEIVGMWVCNDNPADGESQMMIETFKDNGKSVLTGFLPMEEGTEQVLNNETDYKVVGDLLFIEIPADKVGGEKPLYVVDKLIYSPNGTAMGDIMTLKSFVVEGNQVTEVALSFLRIKQTLDLPGNKYDYSATYVSNAKGLDEEISMMGYTFNISKMDGSNLDKMLKHLLFNVEFPSKDTVRYSYHYNGINMVFEAPIIVAGNKVTIKMSALSPLYRDVDMYMFQDADCTQLHMYLPTYAFINYFANMDLAALTVTGGIDLTDTAAVNAVFDRMDARVETINVSFVMKSVTKAR